MIFDTIQMGAQLLGLSESRAFTLFARLINTGSSSLTSFCVNSTYYNINSSIDGFVRFEITLLHNVKVP